MSIIQNGQTITIADITATYEKLQPGVYMLKHNDKLGFHLTTKEQFTLPKKVYGDHSIVDRWLTSFENNSEKNMGIVLSGLKGTGKTVTAQKLCIDSGLPVIMITDAWKGGEFIDFITSSEIGKCILLIDEFEKIYGGRHQEVEEAQRDLLALMDGSYQTNFIFLLTVNEFRISEYLVNRLGRIKYRKDYQNLEEDVIEGVIDDMLINKSIDNINSIHRFFETIGMCTFDLLTNIIKEMNLFGQDALECGKHLNLATARPTWDVVETYRGMELTCNPVEVNFYADEEIEIERRELHNYHKINKAYRLKNPLPTPTNAGDEEENVDIEDYEDSLDSPGWAVDLNLQTCKITWLSKTIVLVEDEENGFKFKFKKVNINKLIF